MPAPLMPSPLMPCPCPPCSYPSLLIPRPKPSCSHPDHTPLLVPPPCSYPNHNLRAHALPAHAQPRTHNCTCHTRQGRMVLGYKDPACVLISRHIGPRPLPRRVDHAQADDVLQALKVAETGPGWGLLSGITSRPHEMHAGHPHGGPR